MSGRKDDDDTETSEETEETETETEETSEGSTEETESEDEFEDSDEKEKELAKKQAEEEAKAKELAKVQASASTTQQPPAEMKPTHLANEPHDEEFPVAAAEELPTPPQSTTKKDPPTSTGQPEVQSLKNLAHDAAIIVDDDAGQVATPKARPEGDMAKHELQNQPHDVEFAVDGGRDIQTPPAQTGRGAVPSGEGGQEVHNQPHDAVYEVGGDSRHIATPPGGAGNKERSAAKEASGGGRIWNEAHDEEHAADGESVSSHESMQEAPKPAPAAEKKWESQALKSSQETGGSSDNESQSSTDDENTSPSKPGNMNLYDPQDYADLKVSQDVKELFQFITVYKPHEIEIEPKLHLFVPDYIPAIGDIDGFIKVPRPDEKMDSLGLVLLDEPGANQSNPAIAWKIESVENKIATAPEENVTRVDDAHSRPQVIDKWVSELQKHIQNKFQTTVTYSKPMPDLETLLQVWPADFEDLISRADVTLPPALIDLDLVHYVRVLCTLLDIPCYDNLVESVHVLLSLYAEFKANQHFQGGTFSNIPL